MAINHTERFKRERAIIQDIAAHPAVNTVVNECATGSGYWVYLKPGYVWEGTTSHVHESTPSRCLKAMAGVRWDPIAWGHACGASRREVEELLAWANLQWAAVDNPQTVPASVDQVRGR